MTTNQLNVAAETSRVSSDNEQCIKPLSENEPEDDCEDIGPVTVICPQSIQTIQDPIRHSSWRTDKIVENDIYITELSSLQLLIARQVAALALHPLVDKYCTLNSLLDTVDPQQKKTVWSKMLGVMKKTKSNTGGIIGKPLDVLVHENGVDSEFAYGPGTVRIPVFIEECIRALKQKGIDNTYH